jgi:hypothetical protein
MLLMLWPDDPNALARRFPWVAALVLSAVLCLTAGTVNRERLHDPTTNRYYTHVFKYWNSLGIRSFGLWLNDEAPSFYQQGDTLSRLHFYGHSSTGFIVPAYIVDRVITSVRGRSSGFVVQLYSQVIVLASSLLISLIGFRIGVRRGLPPLVAGTFGLCAGLVFQNFKHNLAQASEIMPTSVSVLLMLVVIYSRDVAWDGPAILARRLDWVIGTAMFWMTLSDLVIVPAFFGIAVGLVALYGISTRLTLRRWALVYVTPVILAFGLFRLQLALGRAYLGGVTAIGTPDLVRMGLNGRDTLGLGGHRMILTFLRDQWAWWGFAGLALAALVLVLFHCRRAKDDVASRELTGLLPMMITYILLASAFSELVLIHPYIYDLLLIVPSALLVCVHAPVAVSLWYPRQGLVALVVLMFSLMYVWVNIVDYAMMVKH